MGDLNVICNVFSSSAIGEELLRTEIKSSFPASVTNFHIHGKTIIQFVLNAIKIQSNFAGLQNLKY
jgi:hypothetical protein